MACLLDRPPGMLGQFLASLVEWGDTLTLLSAKIWPSRKCCFCLWGAGTTPVLLLLKSCRQLFLTLYPPNFSPQEVFTPAPSGVWSLRQDPPVIRKQNRVPMVSCLVNGCRTWLPSPLLERGCKALGNRKLIICESETPNWKMWWNEYSESPVISF